MRRDVKFHSDKQKIGCRSLHSKLSFCKSIKANCKMFTANCKSITAFYKPITANCEMTRISWKSITANIIFSCAVEWLSNKIYFAVNTLFSPQNRFDLVDPKTAVRWSSHLNWTLEYVKFNSIRNSKLIIYRGGNFK